MLMRPAGNFYVNTCLLAPVLRGYPSPLLLLLLLPRFPERRWKRSGFRTLPKGVESRLTCRLISTEIVYTIFRATCAEAGIISGSHRSRFMDPALGSVLR